METQEDGAILEDARRHEQAAVRGDGSSVRDCHTTRIL
jgi:hypothetical protein